MVEPDIEVSVSVLMLDKSLMVLLGGILSCGRPGMWAKDIFKFGPMSAALTGDVNNVSTFARQ